MRFLLCMTERCNLSCAYCEKSHMLEKMPPDINYTDDELIRFLKSFSELELEIYGGEPLLRTDLLEKLVREVPIKHFFVQTNGLLLDRVGRELGEEVDVFSISLDGPPQLTNRLRGKGVYERAIANAKSLRDRGYRGRVDVRMTISPGADISTAVGHFLGECEFSFAQIYWQLNVLFHELSWKTEGPFVQHWLTKSYQPGIEKLAQQWGRALEDGHLQQIVPFATLAHAMLTGEPAVGVRCGAGSSAYAIATNGKVVPCPVMRFAPKWEVGDIRNPASFGTLPVVEVGAPCDSCDLLDLCGGRCLYANKKRMWPDEGFTLICDTVRYLCDTVRINLPAVERAIAAGWLTIDELDMSADYEVIP
ncbi:MAG: hypothetical protein A2289_24925 [Deltaproteobacteria bacterium RIFOXYA12_FULL_58_15]|nr:MAG: hypothetical protein A2289_24925 [Deltaproteobacteria bacterium RIFOXYA12_FULL_58_15]